MTEDHREPISRGGATGNSRRRILRLLGVGGASGLLAVAGIEALAGERPHQRLQDRTPKRNRKQRNKRQDNNDNQNNNTNGGGGLGATILDTQKGVSVLVENKGPSVLMALVDGHNPQMLSASVSNFRGGWEDFQV